MKRISDSMLMKMMKGLRMPKNKLFIPILSSVGLTILIILIVNLAIQLTYPQPEFPRCEVPRPVVEGEVPETSECDKDHDTFTEEMNIYNQKIFFIYGIAGLIAIALGLFLPSLIIQITGLSAGFIFIIEGMVRNREATLTLLIAAIVLLAIIIFMLYRFNKKYEWF